jgi:hypothetical protein
VHALNQRPVSGEPHQRAPRDARHARQVDELVDGVTVVAAVEGQLVEQVEIKSAGLPSEQAGGAEAEHHRLRRRAASRVLGGGG